MTTEFTQYRVDRASHFAEGNVMLGENVSVHMKEWADDWNVVGCSEADLTRLVIMKRLCAEGLIVNVLNFPLSKRRITDIVVLLQAMHRNQAGVYLHRSTSAANKKISKEIMLLVDASMKDFGHIFSG
jgi:hypothetical protein